MHDCTIYIDDVDIQTLGVHIDDSFSMPMFNTDHINSISIPGRPGELYYNDKPGTIIFKIPLYSISDDEYERQNTMRQFKKLLIDNNGRTKLVKLKNSQEPDIYYNVRLSSSNEMDKDMHQLGEFELELTCYEGYGLLVQEDSLLWGDKVVPLSSYNYTFADSETGTSKWLNKLGTLTVDVKGYNTYPIIKVSGNGTNIRLELNRVVCYISELINQTVVIDCVEKSVFLSGSYNLEILTSMNWLSYYLKPGTNSLNVSGTDLNITVDIDYEERFY